MSDFDKEAEREKLREKYERDREERRTTQRMSDLLLKGATMTNAHCGTCGDPLFQQDDTTFCPSCHGNPDAVRGTDLEAQPAAESADEADSETASERTADREPSSRTAETESAATDGSSADAAKPDRQRSQPSDADTADDPQRSSTDTAAASPSRAVEPSPGQSPPQTDSAGRDIARRSAADDRRRASSSQPADGDLEASRASLRQALKKFASKAAATDDPRYAKDCLEAAREASETLETLR
ncbi:Sjogren's syndrome/scleroderma autoantigen 1 family protein [Natronorubrum halophilum]|uniref:Sjogren's syndrome/scleroderma autoantigen 1 family protein n=1 Tax=Natronorubrum halophilum TaxID=1702106 RepID=UPI000EF6AEF1|nr:Sjogren's syndrome/scleroderma autoantigen 1 family protein [Natronorubrum halophilum]